jgi:hypothetical protein
MMLPFDDTRWTELKGGYKVPFDVSPVLARLECGEDVWDELWQELHHQGDVGEASYAAVPHLVRIAGRLPSRDWNIYALVSTIEVERHRRSNPPVPNWLAESYRTAWDDLLELALYDLRRVQDRPTIQSILGSIALAKGDLKLGALIAHSDESEIDEMLETYYAWSDAYGSRDSQDGPTSL